ncbi:MAG: hypothetical protein J6T88_10640 [Bacteroidales bacterium]|nr:hypothetical protein [Bacteroidales bacterium]
MHCGYCRWRQSLQVGWRTCIYPTRTRRLTRI